MSKVLEFRISEISFLGVVIMAILLALLLKIINLTVMKKTANHRIRNYLPIIGVVVWFIFILWAINVLLKESFYQMIAILSLAAIIAIGLGWFVIRDLFAGIVLRFSDSFYPGQSLQIDQQSGRIEQVGMLKIALQREDGIIFKIPWSKINGQIYSKGIGDDLTNRHRFLVEVAQKYPLEIVHPKIREAIFLSVGAALNKEPQIKLTGTNNQEWQLEITAYTLGPEYFRIIESNVKQVLNTL